MVSILLYLLLLGIARRKLRPIWKGYNIHFTLDLSKSLSIIILILPIYFKNIDINYALCRVQTEFISTLNLCYKKILLLAMYFKKLDKH
jgi:hypothetical protein